MDLIKHIEENFFAVCRYWGGLNSSLIQTGSIGAMNTGAAIADINWVWNEKPLTNDDAKSIADIIEYLQKIKSAFLVVDISRRTIAENEVACYKMRDCV